MFFFSVSGWLLTFIHHSTNITEKLKKATWLSTLFILIQMVLFWLSNLSLLWTHLVCVIWSQCAKSLYITIGEKTNFYCHPLPWKNLHHCAENLVKSPNIWFHGAVFASLCVNSHGNLIAVMQFSPIGNQKQKVGKSSNGKNLLDTQLC